MLCRARSTRALPTNLQRREASPGGFGPFPPPSTTQRKPWRTGRPPLRPPGRGRWRPPPSGGAACGAARCTWHAAAGWRRRTWCPWWRLVGPYYPPPPQPRSTHTFPSFVPTVTLHRPPVASAHYLHLSLEACVSHARQWVGNHLLISVRGHSLVVSIQLSPFLTTPL